MTSPLLIPRNKAMKRAVGNTNLSSAPVRCSSCTKNLPIAHKKPRFAAQASPPSLHRKPHLAHKKPCLAHKKPHFFLRKLSIFKKKLPAELLACIDACL
jgi:hypothetical protein